MAAIGLMYEFMKKVSAQMVNLIVQKSSFTTQTETMNKLNQLDFTGTNIYCGLDVSRRFIEKLEAHDYNNNVQLKAALQIMLTDDLQKRKLLLQVIKAIRQLYRQEPYKKNMELIVSIPGIGEINAAVILFELQNINRLKTFDKLCSYVGFIPDTDDSGETKRNKGITHRFNNRLRKTLI